MRSAVAVRADNNDVDLFTQIGDFLAAQGLSPDPVNYAFAYDLLSRGDAEARAILARLGGDGVRLSRRDIESMGGGVATGATQARAETRRTAAVAAREEATDRLATEMRRRADSIAAMAREMHEDTRGFGRDLAESAAAIDPANLPDAVSSLTRAMIGRAASAEARLAQVTEEADTLRAELAEAQGDARRDPLTGLANRRALTEAYAALPPDGCHYLALCDIDRFKAVNDRFGHVVGDRVIEAIARLLAKGCGDRLVTRHGGEEFAVLFPDTSPAEALAVLDAVRADVAGRRFRDRDSDQLIGTITFSAGLIEIGRDEPIDASLTRVDRLLYAAKAKGRNVVVTG